MEINIEETKELNDSLHQNKSIKEIFEEEEKTATLNNVYETAKKWLGIKDTDTDRIDIILATALSNQIHGTPVWLFLVGASGDWKTTIVEALTGLPNTKKVDQLTKNTLASGMKDVDDLGSELANKSTILLFMDLASLTSANKEEKNIIWGQFRTLYDGDIYKRTGSGRNCAYTNCHVTLIACTTQVIRDEILIHAQLGTRELMYDTKAKQEDNNDKMDKAWENEDYEEEMKTELKKIITNFCKWHKIKNDIKISDEIKKFLKSEATRLLILRAGGAVDYINRELINPIEPEVPSRLIKQLKRIYKGLKSLDENYSDEKAKRIISHIIDSSGDKVRQMVLNILMTNEGIEFKIQDIQHKLRIGRTSVKTQLEMLWNMNVLQKEVREERIGAYVTENRNGYETLMGGRVEQIAYYVYKSKDKKQYEQGRLLKT
jgi:hypothetical protein